MLATVQRRAFKPLSPIEMAVVGEADEANGDLLELTVSGVLDNEMSLYFSTVIDEHLRNGWKRLLLHMPGVTYIGSAGITALLVTKKRLEQIAGRFGICDLTPQVESVLERSRLLDLLRCDPERFRAGC
jgi:stage II sporulation protein AA (anti-sigma F factor antagonist)